MTEGRRRDDVSSLRDKFRLLTCAGGVAGAKAAKTRRLLVIVLAKATEAVAAKTGHSGCLLLEMSRMRDGDDGKDARAEGYEDVDRRGRDKGDVDVDGEGEGGCLRSESRVEDAVSVAGNQLRAHMQRGSIASTVGVDDRLARWMEVGDVTWNRVCAVLSTASRGFFFPSLLKMGATAQRTGTGKKGRSVEKKWLGWVGGMLQARSACVGGGN